MTPSIKTLLAELDAMAKLLPATPVIQTAASTIRRQAEQLEIAIDELREIDRIACAHKKGDAGKMQRRSRDAITKIAALDAQGEKT